MVEQVSNTEKLIGMIIKILQVMGILFIAYIVFIITVIVFYSFSDKTKESYIEGIKVQCSIDENDHIINVSSDRCFNCFKQTKKI